MSNPKFYIIILAEIESPEYTMETDLEKAEAKFKKVSVENEDENVILAEIKPGEYFGFDLNNEVYGMIILKETNNEGNI